LNIAITDLLARFCYETDGYNVGTATVPNTIVETKFIVRIAICLHEDTITKKK
jgi:hypothetical protein